MQCIEIVFASYNINNVIIKKHTCIILIEHHSRVCYLTFTQSIILKENTLQKKKKPCLKPYLNKYTK